MDLFLYTVLSRLTLFHSADVCCLASFLLHTHFSQLILNAFLSFACVISADVELVSLLRTQVSALSHALHDTETQLAAALAEVSRLLGELQVRRHAHLHIVMYIKQQVAGGAAGRAIVCTLHKICG